MALAGQGQTSKSRPAISELFKFKKEVLLQLCLKNKTSIGSSRRMLFTSSVTKCFPMEKVDIATSGKGKYLLIMDIFRVMLWALAVLVGVAQAVVLAGGPRTWHIERGEWSIPWAAAKEGEVWGYPRPSPLHPAQGTPLVLGCSNHTCVFGSKKLKGK